MLLEDALSQFTLQLRADGRSEHTVRQYGRHVRALANWSTRAGRRRCRDVDHRAVAEFMVSPAALARGDGAPKQASSVNTLRTSLCCFFAYLADVGLVAVDPARRLRRARCSPPPPRAIAEGDLRRLLATLRAAGGKAARRDLAAVQLLAESGIRVGSAVALDVDDLDLCSGEAHLRTAKGRARQTVVLPRTLCRHLSRYLGGRVTGPLFPAAGGGRITTRQLQRRLSHWLARAGVRGAWSAHALRHRFAMRLYRGTRDLLLVQRALGHRSVVSTTVYAQVDAQQLRAALR